MSHRKTLNIKGHAHELTFSTYHGHKLLRSERICNWLADAINNARDKYEFRLWAYVIMPNHVHLLLICEHEDHSISSILKTIKQPVGRRVFTELKTINSPWLTRLTRKRGSRVERLFWQSGGGYDRNITEPGTVWNTINYIHANPVRAELVNSPSDWQWSSARWYESKQSIPISVDPLDVDLL